MHGVPTGCSRILNRPGLFVNVYVTATAVYSEGQAAALAGYESLETTRRYAEPSQGGHLFRNPPGDHFGKSQHRLVKEGVLVRHGERRAAYHTGAAGPITSFPLPGRCRGDYDTKPYLITAVITIWGTGHNYDHLMTRNARTRMAWMKRYRWRALDLVHREQPIPTNLRPHLSGLVTNGVLESVGRGARYLLSRQFYNFIGTPVSTRASGAWIGRRIRSCFGSTLRDMETPAASWLN